MRRLGHKDPRIEAQRRWIVEWGEERTEPKELIDLGGGRLLLLVRKWGKGPSSGAVVDSNNTFLFRLSAGRVVHEQLFLDRREALEAVGLSE